MPTPINQQTRVMVPEALMRTSPPHGTLVGAYVEDTPKVIGPGLMHPSGESSHHEGFKEKTYSSLNPESRSSESASELPASILNALKAAKNQENLIEVFKRILENQEVLYELSPDSPTGLPDKYNDFLGSWG